MSSGIRDTSYVFASQISYVITQIGTQSCLAWVLGPEKRGEYAICLVFSTLLNMFCMLGCDTASVYFVSSKKLNLSEGVLYTYIYGGFGSLFAIVVGLIIMQFPLSFLTKASPEAFYLAMAGIPTTFFVTVLIRLFTGIGQFKWFTIFTVYSQILQFLFTVLFVLVFKSGVTGALWSNIIPSIIVIATIMFFLKTRFGFSSQPVSYQKLKDMFHYGLRYYIGKISNTVNVQVGTIILAFMASPIEVGLFAVASQLTIRATMFPDALVGTLTPRAAIDKDGKKMAIAYCARLTMIVCGIILLLMAVFAKPVVMILFSSKFISAVPLIQILCAGTFVRCISKVYIPYLLGINRPGTASFSVAVGTIANIVLLWFLLPMIGIKGAALGTTISYIVSSGILLFAFKKYSKLNFAEMFSFRSSDFEPFRHVINMFYRKIISHIKKVIK